MMDTKLCPGNVILGYTSNFSGYILWIRFLCPFFLRWIHQMDTAFFDGYRNVSWKCHPWIHKSVSISVSIWFRGNSSVLISATATGDYITVGVYAWGSVVIFPPSQTPSGP